MKTTAAFRSVCLSLLLCAAAAPAMAQAWIGILKGTPAEKFDEEDIDLFVAAARKALNETPEKGSVAWENPKTKSRGEITVMAAFTWQTHECKRIRIANEARGRKSTQTMSACRIEDKWRAVGESQLQQK